MVQRSPSAYEFTPHEYGVLEKNLALVGEPLFRAHVVLAMRRDVRTQVRQRVRSQVASQKFETPQSIHFSHEMTAEMVESVREAAFDESRDYMVARADLQAIIESYDESRREQILITEKPREANQT